MDFYNETKEFIEAIMKIQQLKNLSGFLFLNLLFMFVEIFYGIWTNSLGLLTDGAHMLLDCSAILIGIYSCYLVEKPITYELQFGYKRSEVLGTFVNSVFLIFIALYIVFESFERFFNPKEIISNHLIMVSFLGLLVNLVGIFALHDFSGGSCNHSHSHGGSHGHSDPSSHSKADKESGESNVHLVSKDNEDTDNHGHNHSGHSEHAHSHNHSHNHSQGHDTESSLCESPKEKVNESSYENIRAIYIHIVADALGSVSVLISSFFVEYYGLNFTDPLCSILISLLILYSSFPVLKNSFFTLIHTLNTDSSNTLISIKKQILSVSSAITISNIHFYFLNSEKSICEVELTLETSVKDEADELYNKQHSKPMIKKKIEGIMKYNDVSEFFIDIKQAI
mmetsp:Transcript_31736/g.32957  ORF Transcript_31736/g.32957 Transcript_31736/m.32957 type:complete len:395 (-) Transcript_31736:73-1257(-)